MHLPTHLLLMPGLDVMPAVARKGPGSAKANAAAAKGGIIVAPDIHDDILQEIAVRTRLVDA